MRGVGSYHRSIVVVVSKDVDVRMRKGGWVSWSVSEGEKVPSGADTTE